MALSKHYKTFEKTAHAAGLKLTNHASDLYIVGTYETVRNFMPEVRKYLKTAYDSYASPSMCPSSARKHEWFIEIPFGYEPYWEEKRDDK